VLSTRSSGKGAWCAAGRKKANIETLQFLYFSANSNITFSLQKIGSLLIVHVAGNAGGGVLEYEHGVNV
jgi:hypothetical protein